MEEEQQPASYSLFIPEFNKDLSLASSTLDRYNDSIRSCLEKDQAFIQQKVNLQVQSEQNDFFKGLKWYIYNQEKNFFFFFFNYILGRLTVLVYWLIQQTMSFDSFHCNFQKKYNIYWQLYRPSNLYEETEDILAMVPNFGIREGESVHDMDWYPMMNSQGIIGNPDLIFTLLIL